MSWSGLDARQKKIDTCPAAAKFSLLKLKTSSGTSGPSPRLYSTEVARDFNFSDALVVHLLLRFPQRRPLLRFLHHHLLLLACLPEYVSACQSLLLLLPQLFFPAFSFDAFLHFVFVVFAKKLNGCHVRFGLTFLKMNTMIRKKKMIVRKRRRKKMMLMSKANENSAASMRNERCAAIVSWASPAEKTYTGNPTRKRRLQGQDKRAEKKGA